MKTISKMFLFCFIIHFCLSGCVSLENQTLDDQPDSMMQVNKEKIILFSKAKTDLTTWYSCVKDKPKLTINNGLLQISVDQASGDCFGVYFDPKNISAYPYIKVRMKYVGKNTGVDLLGGFTDIHKSKTYYPEKAKMVKQGDGLKDYYFDYAQDFSSNSSQVDPFQINSLLFFLNILGVKNMDGNLLVEELSLVQKPD